MHKPLTLQFSSEPPIAAMGILLLAIGLGYIISTVGPISGWEILAICLLVLPAIMLHRTSLTHPLVLFPTLYLGYFLIGSQNWVERAGHTNFRTYIDTNAFLRLPVLGLVGYIFGVTIVNFLCASQPSSTKTKIIPPYLPGSYSSDWLRRAGVLLCFVGLIGALAAISRHGILIDDPEARAGGLGHVGVFAYALIPAAGLLAITAEKRATSVCIIAGAALLLLITVGFRVTVVILVLSYLIFLSMQGMMRLRGILIGICLVLLLAFAVSTYRLDRSGQASVYGSEIVPTHILAQVPSLTALYYQIPHEGVAVLNSLETLVPDDYPYMHGDLQAATYETAIPHSGKKIDSRGLVTQLVYGTSTIPTTLTPSILGGPYVDFGLTGVVVEMALIGILLACLYRLAIRPGAVFPVLAYAYFLAVLIAGIHTGLLDVQLEVIVPIFTAVALWLASSFAIKRAHA